MKRLVFLYLDGGSAQRLRFKLRVRAVLLDPGLCPFPSSGDDGETDKPRQKGNLEKEPVGLCVPKTGQS